MRTPWDIARLAASALAASPGLQGFCAERFGQALAVYLGGAGTRYENLPRPFAVVRLAGAEDGAKREDTVELAVAVLTVVPGIGFWNGDDASLHFHHHPQQET